MKREFLQGLELSDDIIEKIMKENGTDVAREKQRADNAASERDGIKEQLDAAATSLKGFEGVDVSDLNSKIATLTADLATKDEDYKNKIAERDYNDALSAALGGEKFSSGYAKDGIIAEIKAMGLQLKDGNILGLDDALKSIRVKIPDAFVVEDTNPNKVVIPPAGAMPIGDDLQVRYAAAKNSGNTFEMTKCVREAYEKKIQLT